MHDYSISLAWRSRKLRLGKDEALCRVPYPDERKMSSYPLYLGQILIQNAADIDHNNIVGSRHRWTPRTYRT
jgi:hypothetical protein